MQLSSVKKCKYYKKTLYLKHRIIYNAFITYKKMQLRGDMNACIE